MKKCRKFIFSYFLLVKFSLIFSIKFSISKVGNSLNIIKSPNVNNYPLRILDGETNSTIDISSVSSYITDNITDNFSSIIDNSSDTIFSELIDTSSEAIDSSYITDSNSESISDTISDQINSSWITTDSITELEEIPTISTTYYTDILTDEAMTDLKTDDNTKNNTDDKRNKITENSSLSTGEILAIVIPVILFIIALAIIIAVCGCTAKKPPEKKETFDKIATNLESTTNIINNEKIVPPKQIIYYQINNQVPPIPKVNKVFEPMIPITKTITINQTVQPVIIKKKSKVVKPVQQPQIISEVVDEPEPKHEVIVSSSKILPETHSSEIRESKVLPVKYLPKIKGETKILPLKVLPTIDLGHQTIVENEDGTISKINKDEIIHMEKLPNDSIISGHIIDNSIENLAHFKEAPQSFIDNTNEELSKSLKVIDDLIYNGKENNSRNSKVTEEIIENTKKDTFINIPKKDNNIMSESLEDLNQII